MSKSTADPRISKIQELREEALRLEREVLEETSPWQESFYWTYYAASGFVLGIFGAVASLVFNIVGSSMAGLHPLRLIQVYLTFPLGERALSSDFNSGMVLALGCTLYLLTGMFLGVPFQIAMARFASNASWKQRLVIGSVFGLLLWAVNFYLILSWLQPLLIGGNWITDPKILPPWIGAATHLVFAWTLALLYPWGEYTPFSLRPTLQGLHADNTAKR